MTQKEKQLLLKDLCSRLPYGIKVVYLATTYNIQYVDSKFDEVKLEGMPHTVGIGYIKPYLRPMSNMTEEEFKEYIMFIDYSYNDFTSESFPCVYVDKINDYLNWLNAHHFDYRHLIEKDLALEASEDMYNI